MSLIIIDIPIVIYNVIGNGKHENNWIHGRKNVVDMGENKNKKKIKIKKTERKGLKNCN